jgi:hypothetical protein
VCAGFRRYCDSFVVCSCLFVSTRRRGKRDRDKLDKRKWVKGRASWKRWTWTKWRRPLSVCFFPPLCVVLLTSQPFHGDKSINVVYLRHFSLFYVCVCAPQSLSLVMMQSLRKKSKSCIESLCLWTTTRAGKFRLMSF